MKGMNLLCLAVAAGFALGGCGTAGTAGSVAPSANANPGKCSKSAPNPSDCTIEVNLGTDPTTCVIAVDDVIEFSNHGNAKWIYWTLVGPANYTFPFNGIDFNGHPSDFGPYQRKDNDRTFRVHNKHVTQAPPGGLTYKYTITVSGGQGCNKDPWIRNQ